MISLILISFLGGLFINLVLTPYAIRLCHKYNFLEKPAHRKIHDTPVPKLGGVAFLLSALLMVVGYIIFRGFGPFPAEVSELHFILGATLAFGLVGFLDDTYDLKPSFKIMIQFLITGCFVMFGYRFRLIQIPGFSPITSFDVSIPFTILWMMAVINGFNFMDGVDGLAGSVSAVCLLGLGIISTFVKAPVLSVLIFSSLGAILGFLRFNWSPAKIYLGNCGSNLLGALITAFLLTYNKTDLLLPTSTDQQWIKLFPYRVFICSFLVGYPVLEVALSTMRRGVKRLLWNRSMEGAEKEHIHHSLLKLGHHAPDISWIGAIIQAIFSFAAILVLFNQKALAVWVLVPLFMALSYAMPRMGFFDFLNLKLINKQKPHYLILHHFIFMQRIKLSLAVEREEILALLNQTCAELGVQYFQIKVKDDRYKSGYFSFYWQRPYDIVQEYLNYIKTENIDLDLKNFKDKFVLNNDQGEADWIFEPHTQEDDLDVECRVLVSEFMQTVLLKIYATKETNFNEESIMEINQLSHAKVRSSILRRKRAKLHLTRKETPHSKSLGRKAEKAQIKMNPWIQS